jgi:hypothetical protein
MTITLEFIWKIAITYLVIDMFIFMIKQRKLDAIQKKTIVELTKELIEAKKGEINDNQT